MPARPAPHAPSDRLIALVDAFRVACQQYHENPKAYDAARADLLAAIGALEAANPQRPEWPRHG